MNLRRKQLAVVLTRTLYFCVDDQLTALGKKYGLTFAQQHILYLLSISHEPLTPTELSEQGCWHISTVTRLLKPMKAKGLIQIEADKSRPRYKLVSFTQDGENLFQQLVNELKQLDQFPLPLDHISEEDLDHCTKVVQSILEVYKGKEFNQKVVNGSIRGIEYA